MADKWREYAISEIAEVIGGGTPSTSDPSNFDGEIPWITPKDLSIHTSRFISRGERNISSKGLQSSSARLLPAGTVLLTTRAPIGYLAIASNPLTTNQGFRSLILKDQFDSQFVYYLLKANIKTLIANSSGTTFGELSGSSLKKLKFNFPPYAEQRAIAHILGTLDDKIELNRKMSETLEQMATAIFKAWFVDFEPVRAKMAGRWKKGQSLPGLPSHLWDLFPDRLVNSELGEIPEGWEVNCVRDVGKVVCGKTPSTQIREYYGNDVPFITIPDLHNNVFVSSTQKKLSRAGAESQKSKTLPPGSICVSCIATPGLVSITVDESQTNQQINSVIPSDQDQTYYWFWSLRNLGEEIKTSGSGGSVVTNLSTSRFSKLRLIAPPVNLRRAYHSSMMPVFVRILTNVRESRTLAALRDALLPKLISGEIRVKDAERFIKEAENA